jgi:hypothetical protein
MKLFKKKKITKGSRQVKMNLEGKFSIIYSRKKIQRIMRKYGIYCTIRRPNPYKRIAKATVEHSVVANILQRGFKTKEVRKVEEGEAITRREHSKHVLNILGIEIGKIKRGEIVTSTEHSSHTRHVPCIKLRDIKGG